MCLPPRVIFDPTHPGPPPPPRVGIRTPALTGCEWSPSQHYKQIGAMTFRVFFRVSRKKVPLAPLPTPPPTDGASPRAAVRRWVWVGVVLQKQYRSPHTHPCIVGFIGEKGAVFFFCTILVNFAEFCILLPSLASFCLFAGMGGPRNSS